MASAWLLKPLAITSASASSTALGDPAYVGNDFAGVVWRSAAGATATLTLDLGADVAVDTAMLFGLAGGFPATASVTVSLATAAQGAGFGAGSWTSAAQDLLAGAAMPVSGKGVMVWSAAAGAPALSRYVRFSFAGLAGAAVQVAIAVVGKRIQLERNFSFGAGFGVKDLGSLDFNRRGIMLRQRGAKLRTVALTFSNIRKDEVEATTKPLLEQLGNTELVAVLTDPAADAQRQNRAYLGPLVGDLSHVWRKATAWEAKINLVSVF